MIFSGNDTDNEMIFFINVWHSLPSGRCLYYCIGVTVIGVEGIISIIIIIGHCVLSSPIVTHTYTTHTYGLGQTPVEAHCW